MVLLCGGDQETALRHARFLESIGEAAETLTSDRCKFCHSEQAHPVIEAAVAKYGHYILQVEGGPNPFR